MDKILVSRKQAAKFLNVSTQTIDRRIKDIEDLSPRRYKLPVYKSGRMVRINLICLLDYIGYEDFFKAGVAVPPFQPEVIAKELALINE